MSITQQAHIWVKDATEKLHAAERAGEHASSLLLETRNALSKGNEHLDRSLFLLDAIQGQMFILDTIIRSMRDIRSDRAHSFKVLTDAVERSVEEVESTFMGLKDITVDPALQDERIRGSTRSLTLYDFVSSEIFDVLKQCQVDLEESYNGLELEVDERERMMVQKSKIFTELLDSLEKEVAKATGTESSLAPDVLEEIRGLEEEVAALLESLTAHYDQCVRGVDVAEGRITEITEQEQKELFAVLEKDFHEVPEVLNDLEDALGDIEQRFHKIEEHLAGQGLIYGELKQLSKDLKTYGDEALTLTIKDTEKHVLQFQAAARSANERCDEASELISHYDQFTKSYYSLILELERRRNMQEAMYKVIEETQNKLQSMQEDDYRHRESFMRNHGSFLPSDLWVGFGDERPLYDLSVVLNDVPMVNKNTVNTAKKVTR